VASPAQDVTTRAAPIMTTIGAILALLRDMQPPSDGSARPSLRVAEDLSASGS
jgi:hypothetical protein